MRTGPNRGLSAGQEKSPPWRKGERWRWDGETIRFFSVETVQKLSSYQHLSLDVLYTEVFTAHHQLNACLPQQTDELNKKLISTGFVDFLFAVAGRYQLVDSKHHKAPFTSEICFEILFQNKNFEIFLSKVSTFTLEINFRKPTSTTVHWMFVNTGRLTNHSAP